MRALMMRRSRLPPIVAVLAMSILGCGSPPVRSSPDAAASENGQDPAATAEPATKGNSSREGGQGWVELASEADGPTIRITGTVEHQEVEGGVWIIRTDEGKYQPMNLPPAFQVDGMAVEAEAVRRTDMVSIGMVGPLVELLRIRQGDAESRPPRASQEP